MRSILLVLGALLVSLAAAMPARAATPAGNAPSADRPAVRLSATLVGRVDSSELRELISEWLGPIGLEVRIASQSTLHVDDVLAADEDPERVRVWLVLADTRRVRLYFADPSAERFLVRDVPLEQGLDEVGREQLAQVLVSAAQAFVERRESTPRASVTQALAPPRAQNGTATVPDGASRAPLTPPAHFYWSVGARYTLALQGPGAVSQAPGATLESALDLTTTRLGALAEVRYELPHRLESADLQVTVSALALRLGLVLALVRVKQRELRVELGAGLDRVLVDPDAREGSAVQPRRSRTHLRPSVGGALAHSWCAGDARLGVGLRADLSFYQAYYDVLLGAERRREIRPWQVQPAAFVMVAWH